MCSYIKGWHRNNQTIYHGQGHTGIIRVDVLRWEDEVVDGLVVPFLTEVELLVSGLPREPVLHRLALR
jgi:hypothetical protein